MSDSRLVFVRAKDGRLPYSKGVMTQTLTATGLSPERGHAIASLVEERLTNGGRTGEELTVRELQEFVQEVLREQEGDDAADRYRRWTALKRKDIPIIMLVGGTAGSGKSTVAQQVASNLGITRVSSTDMVRQVMRALFSPALMPVLHHSSFDVPVGGMALPRGARHDLGLLGYLEQSRQVCVGVNAILERAERERVSTLIEGVHLVPGLVDPVDVSRSAVIDTVVYIEDEQTHRSHFTMRAMQTDGSRPVDHYLRSFDRIRQIQDYLVEQANRRGVPVLENTYLDDTVRRLVDHTLDVVERVAVERDAAGAAGRGGGPAPMPGVGAEHRSDDVARALDVALTSDEPRIPRSLGGGDSGS
ncbi:MAG: (d)CMP kinase [Thermoleophilia bacterium]|nr:(d)CMP kinase [Thermoleophilia bacterium]